MNTIVLQGVGPTLHLASSDNKPTHLRVVSKGKITDVKLNKQTDIKFAA